MAGPLSQTLTINGVEVDLAAEVLRDGHGGAVPMRPQAFAVLRHLLGNPGRLVAKDELMAAVWPGIAVTDDSLVQCIHEIRRALRDESHVVVRTVPRRGYRLVLPAASAASTAPVRGRRWRIAVAAVAVALLLGLVAAAWNRTPPVSSDTNYLLEGASSLAVGELYVLLSLAAFFGIVHCIDAPDDPVLLLTIRIVSSTVLSSQ
jgi:DNA-binding winged helix-turn-helix (wHTH) protein